MALLLRGQPDAAQALLGMSAADTAPLRTGAFRVLRARLPHVPHGESRISARRVSDSDPAETLIGLERWAAEDPTARLAVAEPDGELVVVLAEGIDPTGAVAALGPDGRAGLGAAHPLAELTAADATARAALARATAHLGHDHRLGAQTDQIRPHSRRTGDHGVVLVQFEDLLDDGLPALLPDAAADGFARRVLGPLATSSPGTDQLLATLDAYQEHHCRLAAVAATLGVHRNTVRRRLRRIEELTGRSPATPRGRAELWVAVEIARRDR